MKTCNTCKMEKPANAEYFHRDKRAKDGLVSECKECRKEKNQKYYQKNKEKILEYSKKYREENKEYYAEYYQENKEHHAEYMKKHYQENKEKYRERNKKHRQENKEYHAEYGKKYRQENREKLLEYYAEYYQENKEHYAEYYAEHYQENKEYYREYSKKHRQENREYHREYGKKHRQENKEKYRGYSKKYRQENPEVNRLSEQRRRARLAQLPHTLTLEEWEEALEFFNHSCAYCGVPEDNLHQEHVIPVVKGGGYTADNVIPACRTCNTKKHTTDLEEWYVSYRHYDEERLNKILDYVENYQRSAILLLR